MKKKVLIITYYWPPSGGAGVQRWLKYSRYLLECGIQPVIVTVAADKAGYPVIDNSLLAEVPKEIPVHRTPTFEPFEMYKAVARREQIPFAGFANEGKVTFFKKIVRFIRGNFFIPDARKGWNSYAFKKCCELIEQENIDTIITTSPPHSTQLIGLKLKQKYSINWIADIRDPWTNIYYYDKLLHTQLAKNKDLSYEKSVLENADTIITVSNGFKKMFLGKSEIIADSKIVVLQNGYDETDFKFNSAVASNEFRITYTGTITNDYAIDGFIAAFKKLVEQYPSSILKLRFVGSISGEIKNKLEANLTSNIEFISHVSHLESLKYLCESTLLLLAIPKVKMNEGILPGKLFEYLASQKFIICLGPITCDAAQIINACKAGETFDYDDSTAIYNFLDKHYLQWKNGESLRNDCMEFQKYSRRKQAEFISKLIFKN